MFDLKHLTGSQSWVCEHGVGGFSGTDGELHCSLPGNTHKTTHKNIQKKKKKHKKNYTAVYQMFF